MIPARGSRRGGLRDVVAHSTTTTTKASAWEPPRRSTFVCVSLCVSLFSCFSLLSSPPPRVHTHTHTPHRRRPRPSSPVRRRFSRLWGPHPHRPSLNLNLLIALIIVVIRPQPPSLGTPGGPWDPGGAENAKSTLDLGKKKKRKRNSNADRGLGTPPNKRFLLFRGVTFANASKIGSPGGGGGGGGGGVQAKTGARQKNAATPTTEESRLQVRR